MGAIKYGFDSVPALPSDPSDEDARQLRVQYGLILRSAESGARAVGGVQAPPAPTVAASREEIVLYLQQLAGAIVKAEVESQPELFEGMSNAQIAQILRRLQIPNLPCGPNLLSPEDVAAALTD